MKHAVLFVLLIALAVGLAACGSVPETEADLGSSEQTEVVPTDRPTPTVTATPAPTPTAIGGGDGRILYSKSVQERAPQGDGTFLLYTGYALNSLDLGTLDSEELISKEQLEQELGKDLYRTRFSPSPDGTKVLITASTSVSFGKFDTYEYYIASLDLEDLVPVLDPGATVINWTWSPDGSSLLGDALESNKKTIYIVNSDGSGLTKLTEFPAIASPVWSADGTRIFWAALGNPMVMDAEGTNQEIFTELEPTVASLSFSPDGGKAAFLTDESTLYTAHSDFSDAQWASGRFDSSSCDGKFPPHIQAWSNDGEYLIVRTYVCAVINRQLFPTARDVLVRTNDRERVNVASRDSKLCGWSPDNMLVYIDDTDEGDRLIMADMGSLDGPAAFEMKYTGGCPDWIR